jgi:hypothetical protein
VHYFILICIIHYLLIDIQGKKSWFNSIVAAYLGWTDSRNDGRRAITFSDGELMQSDDVMKCAKILEESCVCFPWAQGDVLVIDNRQALHARKPFEPPRRILAALFQ